MEKYVCIHGHFYQPPRENAWLETVEQQDSAYPYHDWNERISVECYRPNAASRILGPENRVIGIVNNYSQISFNFGPTLLAWMEEQDPETYRAIQEADRLSRERFSGHGSAIAQVYNHSIMPLNNQRDKVTQVLWGIADFERRFGRRPEGMWLAETAVDLETLEILAANGILFTILAPGQARRVRAVGQEDWTDVDGARINPRLPYLCRLPSGASIALFFYNGPLSHDMSFGGLLKSGIDLANRLLGAFPADGEEAPLVHTATDGETFGHHHKQGEMALTYCLYHISSNKLARLTIYGEYLERHPPQHEVEIHENTSWSCAHGVDRWRSNCGDRLRADWQQEWRAPLRKAMDWLRDSLIPLYESEMGRLGADPWKARDGYVQVILDRAPENVDRFIAGQTGRALPGEERVDFLRLLEMQRHALLMYTSCGWFFDEISGIETTQVIQYAARAMQMARQVSGADLEPTFVRLLAKAPSNLPEIGNGRQVYELYVQPARVDLMRVAAHYAIVSLFRVLPNGASADGGGPAGKEVIGTAAREAGPPGEASAGEAPVVAAYQAVPAGPATQAAVQGGGSNGEASNGVRLYAFIVRSDPYERLEAGRRQLAVGRAIVFSRVLGNESRFDFAILHLGDHNIHGGLRPAGAEEAHRRMHGEVKEAFQKSDVAETIRTIDKSFEQGHTYSLWDLFRDQQREIVRQILAPRLEMIETFFQQVYADSYPIMQAMQEMRSPLPRELSAAGEIVVSSKLRRLMHQDSLETRPDDLKALVEDIRRFSLPIDAPAIGLEASDRIKGLMERIRGNPRDVALIEATARLLEILRDLPLGLDLGKAQNIYYELCRDCCADGEGQQEWRAAFDRLGVDLYIQCR